MIPKKRLKKWRIGKKRRKEPVDYELEMDTPGAEGKYKITDVSFFGMTLREYDLNPASKIFAQVFAVKKFLKNFPYLAKKVTPSVQDIKVEHYHAHTLQEIKKIFIEDLLETNAEIKEELDSVGKWPEWSADTFTDWTSDTFDILTTVVEADPYYRGQWFRFIRAVNTWIKAQERIHGPTFMQDLVAIHNRDTEKIIAAYKEANGPKEPKHVR